MRCSLRVHQMPILVQRIAFAHTLVVGVAMVLTGIEGKSTILFIPAALMFLLGAKYCSMHFGNARNRRILHECACRRSPDSRSASCFPAICRALLGDCWLITFVVNSLGGVCGAMVWRGLRGAFGLSSTALLRNICPRLETMIQMTHRITSGITVISTLALVLWTFRGTVLRRVTVVAAAILMLNEDFFGALIVILGKVARDQSPSLVSPLTLHF